MAFIVYTPELLEAKNALSFILRATFGTPLVYTAIVTSTGDAFFILRLTFTANFTGTTGFSPAVLAVVNACLFLRLHSSLFASFHTKCIGLCDISFTRKPLPHKRFCSPGMIRTCDTPLNRRVLCQTEIPGNNCVSLLSYHTIFHLITATKVSFCQPRAAAPKSPLALPHRWGGSPWIPVYHSMWKNMLTTTILPTSTAW